MTPGRTSCGLAVASTWTVAGDVPTAGGGRTDAEAPRAVPEALTLKLGLSVATSGEAGSVMVTDGPPPVAFVIVKTPQRADGADLTARWRRYGVLGSASSTPGWSLTWK